MNIEIACTLFVAMSLIALFFKKDNKKGLYPESLFIVTFNDEMITVNYNKEEVKLFWNDLTKVDILTTDEGPWFPDVFWRLYSGTDEAVMIFPNGSTGEAEIIKELEKRLKGYNDSQVINAMSSTKNAVFTVWEKPA